MGDPDDYWAEGEKVSRLSTRVPGLGNETGLIDLYAPWMEDTASQDADVADFLKRARNPYGAWLIEFYIHSEDAAKGCHPPE